MSIHKPSEKLIKGEITFDQYAAITKQDWLRIGQKLFYNWRPKAVDVEDIVQDLLMFAFVFKDRFDPSRGVSAGSFILFNAVDKTKKKIHDFRDLMDRHRKDTSKIYNVCSIFDIENVVSKVSVPPEQERVVYCHRVIDDNPEIVQALFDCDGDIRDTIKTMVKRGYSPQQASEKIVAVYNAIAA